MAILCLTAFLLVTSTLPSFVQMKTWVFAVNGIRRPWNFIDDDGILKGADLDLIQAVCDIADKKCAMTLATPEGCVESIDGRFFPGESLMERWFDACVGYVSSVDRTNALQFTDPIRTTTSTFTVLKGNPKNFNPKNLQNAVIVRLSGDFTNEQCTVRIGLGKPKNVIVASGIAEAKQFLTNRSADALFSPRTRFDDLEVLSERYKCDINGVGMMVKKDSDLPLWWNPAFQKYHLSGKYNEACDQISQKYGDDDSEKCLNRKIQDKSAALGSPDHFCLFSLFSAVLIALSFL